VISRRFVKKQQMRWQPETAHLLLQVRTRTLNGALRETFQRWWPAMTPVITDTRARPRAVYRKSIDELHQMLALMEGPQAAADRARLSTLGPKDKYLALTKAHYDNIRANITYSRLDARGRGRVQFAAELPLMYTAGRWPTQSEVKYPSPVDELANQPRRTRQSELEAEPFLESMPVYRYVHR